MAVDKWSGLYGSGGDNVHELPLEIRRASMRPAHTIPPRPWLYANLLLRGYTSLVIAPGGVGKTAYCIAIALACCTGRRLLDEWVHKPLNVLFCFLEDPEDEFDRRVAAGRKCHGITDKQMLGDLWIVAGRERRLVMATVAPDGSSVIHPDRDALIAEMRARRIDVVIVDPFIKTHTLDENSNPDMDRAVTAWAELAQQADAAVLLVHHASKSGVAGDVNSSRGAGSLKDGARAAIGLVPMTETEAERFGIADKERRLHVRITDAKNNMSLPPESAAWLRLASVELRNATPEYPAGDRVQAATRWVPKTTAATLSPLTINAILDRIGAGIGHPSTPCTASRRGKSNDRWAGRFVAEELECSDEQAASVIAEWLRDGLLVESTYRNAKAQERKCVTVNDAKRPSVQPLQNEA